MPWPIPEEPYRDPSGFYYGVEGWSELDPWYPLTRQGRTDQALSPAQKAEIQAARDRRTAIAQAIRDADTASKIWAMSNIRYRNSPYATPEGQLALQKLADSFAAQNATQQSNLYYTPPEQTGMYYTPPPQEQTPVTPGVNAQAIADVYGAGGEPVPGATVPQAGKPAAKTGEAKSPGGQSLGDYYTPPPQGEKDPYAGMSPEEAARQKGRDMLKNLPEKFSQDWYKQLNDHIESSFWGDKLYFGADVVEREYGKVTRVGYDKSKPDRTQDEAAPGQTYTDINGNVMIKGEGPMGNETRSPYNVGKTPRY